MKNRESAEDYLETILILSKTDPDVHAVEVARSLGVTKPSVSRAMKILAGRGYIEINDNHIHLTDAGRGMAEAVFERHNVISSFLTMHGVSKDCALADACRLEHFVSSETFDMMKSYVESGKK